MATRSLLKRLSFREFMAPKVLPLRLISVQYGDPKTKSAIAARKFAQEYLPVLVYKFPSLKTTQLHVAAGEASAVTITLHDGSTRAVPLDGRNQRAIYCDVTGLDESELPEENVPKLVKHTHHKRRKAKGKGAETMASPVPTET